MRAALLPAGSDPFLDAWWLHHYAAWADKVDELRVIVCNQPDPEVQAYLMGIAESLPHVVMTFGPRREHGDVIGDLIEATSADLVMLCEDDAFVRRPEAVGQAFARIESGDTDIVACPRASMTPDVRDAAIDQYGLFIAESGEQGPAFWPTFFFGRREDLRATDRHYGAGLWKVGEQIPGLDYISQEGSAADTFSTTSFQLRGMGLRVHIEAQWRTDTAMVNEADAPWFHVGSLSSGHGTYFMGGMDERTRKRHGASIDDSARTDWQKRMAWWERVRDEWDGGIPDYHARYAEELAWLFDDIGMDPNAVDFWRRSYERLVA